MPINPSEIEDRFEEAALTLRRPPNPPGSGPKGDGSSWPEYVHDAKHAYGYREARMRVVPSAKDIERMEECIEWLRLVEASEGRIIWLRAERVRWRPDLHPHRLRPLDRLAPLGCVAGPVADDAPEGCSAFEFLNSDLDGDGDVDLADVGLIQRSFTVAP